MEQNKNETLESFFIEKYKKIEEENEKLKKEIEEKNKIKKALDNEIAMIKALVSNAETTIVEDFEKVKISFRSTFDFSQIDLENGVYLRNDTIGSKFLDFMLIYGKLVPDIKEKLIKFRKKEI